MNTSKRLLIVLALALLAAAIPAAAQSHPNSERGFVPEKVYNFSGIDSVNVFNGNLTLTIPIGGTYPVSSSLSYGITLYYNSKVWDYVAQTPVTYCGAQQGAGMVSYPVGHLSKDNANAGFGWRLSLGRLDIPEHSPYPGGTYVSPDGAFHPFSERTPTTDTIDPKTDWSNKESTLVAIGYTGDGSNLRIKKFSSGERAVEFPDGTSHVFNAAGELILMRDRFENFVYVYHETTAAGTKQIRIVDPHGRQQKIIFKKWYGSDVAYFNEAIVDRVELTAFDGATATYQFKYDPVSDVEGNASIERGCYTEWLGEYCNSNYLKLPMLRRLILPDGSQYSFDYYVTSEGMCAQGAIKKLTMPTSGSIEWKYGDYWLNTDGCDLLQKWLDSSVGVRQKTLYDGGGLRTWTYDWAHSDIVKDSSPCPDEYLPGGELPQRPIRQGAEYFIKALTDPAGRTTLHYFSTWNDDVGSVNLKSDYGYPFTRNRTTDLKENRYLSRKVCLAGTGIDPTRTNFQYADEAGCVPLRTTYVDYHFPPPGFNGNAGSELVVFGNGDWMDTERSPDPLNRDGFGNYRTTVTSTNFPTLRSVTSTTNYNEGSTDRKRADGFLFFKAGDPWVLNKFTTQSSSQSTGGPSSLSVTSVCYDANGQLLGRRVHKSAADSRNDDAVVRYTYEGGNAIAEDWYGGDGWETAHQDLCATIAPSGSRYHVDHDYQYGALKTSQYSGMPFKSVDNDIDVNTGLVKTTRDTAGVATTFRYDAMGRLTEVAPASRSATTYTYTKAGTSTPASVLVARGPNTTDGTRSKYEFDAIGRVWREHQLMPHGAWSMRETKYDEVGRRQSVSEMGNGGLTVFSYDDLDRTKTITVPDGSVTSFLYNDYGNTADLSSPRWKTRLSTVAMPTGEGTQYSTEEYDGLGRLVSVREPAGVNGADVYTDYTYDHANRLLSVKVDSKGTPQPRAFAYDGRGFLASETHPENGTTTYAYDMKGKMTAKDAAGTAFDVSYSYDDAERMTGVWEGLTPETGRPVKSFVFGPSAGRTLGKLLKAIRFNYPEANAVDQRTFRVTETYDYDTAGRKNKKFTDIETQEDGGPWDKFVNTISQTVEYDGLDLPKTIYYPTCGQCGMPEAGARSLAPTYKHGRLYSIPGFVTSTEYSNAGLWRERIHTNQVKEEQVFDPSGMPRPLEIRAYNVVDCALITAQPHDQNILSGGDTSFSVAVSDPGATYQWYTGVRGVASAKIDGATTSTLNVTDVTSTTAYWVEVKSGAGCLQESDIVRAIVCTPTVITSPAPGETTELSDVRLGDEVRVEVVASGTTTSYSWTIDNIDDAVAPKPAGNTPVMSFTPNTTGTWMITVVVSGGCEGSSSETRTWSVEVLPSSCGSAPKLKNTFPSTIRLPAGHTHVYLHAEVDPTDEPAGSTYRFRWFVDGRLVLKDSSSGDFSTRADEPIEVMVEVSRRNCSGEGTFSTATTKKTFVWKPALCTAPKLNVDQTEITIPSANNTFTATTAWPGVTFTWYHGDSGNTKDRVVTSSWVTALPREYGSGSVLHPPLDRSGTYWVRATASCGLYTDSATLLVEVNGCPPVQILRQPTSTDISAGQQHTLSFEPAGTPAVNRVNWYYYWGNGLITPEGGTSRSLTVSPRKTTGYYAKATSTDSCDTGTTDVAWVRVTSCEWIDVSHVTPSTMILLGNSIELSAAATTSLAGASPVFKWFQGEVGHGTFIGNGESITVDPEVTTKYYVNITAGDLNDPNAPACAIDREVTITVCDPATVTLDPFPALNPPGYRRWLGVEAKGTNITYQWYIGASGDRSNPIPGADMPQVQVAPYLTTDYWVLVSNACGSDESATAKVSVEPVITAWPAGGNVTKGTRKELKVVAEGNQLKYQWYRGTDDTQPVAGAISATFLTPPIDVDVVYWARVWSGDAWKNVPEQAEFKVCQARNIYAGNSTIQAGASVMLRPDYPDANEYYEWYEGQSGDVSKPLGINSHIYVEPTVTTSYWLRAVRPNECHADSPTFTLYVCWPKITTQPQTQMIDPDTQATLTVVSSGDPQRTYQWYEGQSGDTTKLIPGATGSTYQTPKLTTPKSYWVEVRNPVSASCSTTATKSETANITICEPATVTLDPMSRNSVANFSFILGVEARGTDLTYKWYEGIAPDTSKQLNPTTPNITIAPSYTTNYWVRVTGRCGVDDSTTAKISIPPVINTQPVGGPITKGTSRTLTVTASGTELTYQWLLNGSPITGATSATYVTPAINVDSSYSVRVFSGTSPIDSEEALLTVCQPRTISLNQPSQTAGSQATLQVSQPDGNETYEWYKGASGDTSTPAGTGTSITVSPTVTTQYWLRTKTAECHADSTSAIVVICLPNITAQPTASMINPNATANLSVTATGDPNMTYQWYLGSSGDTTNPITGATSSSYTTQQLTADTSYWVAVKNPASQYCSNTTRNSNTVVVPVCKVPNITLQPVSQTKPVTGSVQLSLDATGTDLTFQWYEGPVGTTTTLVPNGTGKSITVNPSATVTYWAKVSGRCGTAVNTNAAKVYVTPSISVHPASGPITKGTTRQLSVTASGNELTYQWYQGTNTLISGATSASYTTQAVHADTSYFVRIWSGGVVPVDSNPAVLTVCLPRSFTVTQPSQATGSAVTLRADNVQAGETFEWYQGASGVTTSPAGTGAEVTVYPASTTTYWLRTKRSGCDADSAAVTVTVCLPKISANPANASINEGQSTTLSVTATGPAALSYQWYSGAAGITTNPVACTGATCPVSPTTTTSYWVRVTAAASNCANTSVNSTAATVTVCNQPKITREPVNVAKPATTGVELSFDASGTGLTFQWYEGAVGVTTKPVPNGTGKTVNVNPAATVTYWAKVTGTCGTANTVAAKVYVMASISVHPASGPITKGTTKQLSVTASGNELTYQWYQGTNTLINGATSSSYTTQAVNADTSYFVRIWSGGLVPVDSNPALLTVCLPRSFTVTQPSQATGSAVTLRADNVQAGETFEWYQGASGVTTSPAGTGAEVTVYPTTTTTYWLRTVRTGCTADSAAVTVTVCLPKISANPANASINEGQSTTLSVTATGPAALSYQWYSGAAGITTNPVACTGATCPVSPATTTSYWVRVTAAASNCANTAVNSTAATVTVCNQPKITREPVNVAKPATTGVELSFDASGTGLTFQWYEGAVGVTTKPVQNGTGKTVTVNPAATVTYWAKVTGTCGTASTVAAKVYVMPAISIHPASGPVTKGTTVNLSVTASGNELTYQWYQGTNTLINGATSASYTTQAINSDTSYFVRIWSGGLVPVDSNPAVLTVCLPRSFTVTQPSSVTGSTVTLRAADVQAGESFQWYAGASGVTTSPAGTGPEVSVNPTTTTSYWLRTVRTGCTADSAATTVAVCLPKINTHPANVGIVRGDPATKLTVAAVGPQALSYQWYIGTAGITTNPVTTCTAADCYVSPDVTTTYWVRVTAAPTSYCPSGYTSVNSTAATVTVCPPVSITTQPMAQNISRTAYTDLSVTASGSVASYQWYEGAAGVTTKPVGTNSNTLRVIAGTTKYYWVRVNGTCGPPANSNAVLVSVLPTFDSQPANVNACANSTATFSVVATGDPATLSYQWYRKPAGQSPVAIGTNSPSVSLTATAEQEIYCVVTSGNTYAESQHALLTIAPPPYAWTSATRYSNGYYNLFANVVPEEMEFTTFEWFEGRIGDFTRPMGGGSSYIYVYPLPRPKYWWVRVKNTNTGCFTDLEFPFP